MTSSAQGATTVATEDDPGGAFAWFRTLPHKGRVAFAGSFGGYALDSFDFQILPLIMSTVAATFAIGTGEAGLLTTVTLLVSAVGGVGAGMLADKIGRTRTLQITILVYATFTMLCGVAPNFETLLVFRALQGLGFGGEWAAGAILVAEYSRPKYRGRAVAWVQSSWAVGWALAVIVYTIVFQVFPDSIAWRVVFFTGGLPALFILWTRRNLSDTDTVTARLEQEGKGTAALVDIFRGQELRTTIFAALLATGVQGGYYTLATWLPTYLKKSRQLDVVGSSGYLAVLITGAFLGYICGGVLTDKLGRKRNIQLFAVLSMVFMVAYTRIPDGSNGIILWLGFPLGFCASAIFSGFGSFLAELYPVDVRGTGQGFTYNFGRAVGAAFPTAVGFLASSKLGLSGAMIFGALGYLLAIMALLGLPETTGKVLD